MPHKKQFELVAGAIREQVNNLEDFTPEEQESRRKALEALAVRFKCIYEQQSPRFDGVKFLQACGI